MEEKNFNPTETEEKIVDGAQIKDEDMAEVSGGEEKLNPVTFRLQVHDPAATGAYVKHIGHDEFADETIFAKVTDPTKARYVELTVDHF